MRALFVHGMGRSALSGWPMLRQLRKAGIRTSTFSYFVSLQSFAGARDRLATRIAEIARRDDFILIGHSLGGVLIRAALAALPAGARAPERVFLLGSPLAPSRLAQRLRPRLLFRLLTGDCGELLGSAERMRAIAATPCPVTSIVGVRGLSGRLQRLGARR